MSTEKKTKTINVVAIFAGIVILAILIFLVLQFSGFFKQNPGTTPEKTSEYAPTILTDDPNESSGNGETSVIPETLQTMPGEDSTNNPGTNTGEHGTTSGPDVTSSNDVTSGIETTANANDTEHKNPDVTTESGGAQTSGSPAVTTSVPVVTTHPVVTTSPVITTQPHITTSPVVTTGPAVTTSPETTEITPVTPDVTTVPLSPETTEPMETYAIPDDLTYMVEYRDILVAPNGDLVPGYWYKDAVGINFIADLPELNLYETYKWWCYNEFYCVLEYGTYIKSIPGFRPVFVADNPLPPYVHPGTQDTNVYTIPDGTWW